MKYVRAWKWENTWLLYSAAAYLILPWLVAFLTVPHLLAVYAAVATGAVFWTGLFGFCWGFAVVLYGLSADIVGLSLTSGIILGSSVALGSLGPLAFLPAARESSVNTWGIAAVDGVMLVGVVLCAKAGEVREKAQAAALDRPRNPRFRTGILMCFICGLLCTLFNIALAYGMPITRAAEKQGADPFYAANAVWSLAVGLGSLPSLVFAAGKLRRHRTWPEYRAGPIARNVALCLVMGVLWFASTALYGSSTGLLGPLGTVIGWPVFMFATILSNNFWAWVTGEWKGARGRPVALMLAGIAVQILAMVLLGRLK
jgi:L-rhamnose-H+ transport protein